jgi:peptidoglycan/LPS O-acetylase OafA/YrhL
MLRGHSSHLSKEGHRPDIDGLRALAVLPVVFLHFEIFGFGGGFVGVDIFFVISGYLITSILVDALESGRFSFAWFYERRIRRIIPAFIVMLVVVSAACIALFRQKSSPNSGVALPPPLPSAPTSISLFRRITLQDRKT